MWFLRFFPVIALLSAIGCSVRVPVSKVAVVEVKKASEVDTGELVPMTQFGTDRTVFVARESIIQNKHISTIERTYDSQGSDAIVMHFTEEGSKLMAEATTPYHDSMVAMSLTVI